MWPIQRSGAFLGDVDDAWVERVGGELRGLLERDHGDDKVRRAVRTSLVQSFAASVSSESAATAVAKMLSGMLPSDSSSSAAALGLEPLADALWVFDLALTGASDADASARFDVVFAELVNATPEMEREFFAELPVKRVGSALVDSSKRTSSAAIRRMTRQLYAQSRYNLLAEDNEGFAKLLEALSRAAADDAVKGRFVAGSAEADAWLPQFVRQLVGAFGLDPTRVMSLVLDALIGAIHLSLSRRLVVERLPTSWGQLLGMFRPDHVSSILGVKIRERFHMDEWSSEGSGPPQDAGPLALCAALVLLSGCISEAQLLPYLAMDPKGSSHDECVRVTEDGIRECTRVRIGGDEEGSTNPLHARALSAAAGAHDVIVGTLSGHPAADALFSVFGRSAADWIAAGLLHVVAGKIKCPTATWQAEWELARRLLLFSRAQGLPESAWNGQVCAALCRVVRTALSVRGERTESLTTDSTCSFAPEAPFCSVPQVPDRDGRDVWESLGSVFSLLGAHMGNDPQCFQLTATATRRVVDAAVAGDAQALRGAMVLLQSVLLPSLSVGGFHLPMSLQVWECVQPLPWHVRFRLYSWWHDGLLGLGLPSVEGDSLVETASCVPGEVMVRLAAAKAAQSTRQALKRVAKETVVQAAKAMGRLSACSPLSTLGMLVSMLEKYDNLIESAMDALRFAGPLSIDVFSFLLCSRLCSDVPGQGSDAAIDDALATRGTPTLSSAGRNPFQEDGVTPSPWMLALASAAAWLCRKFVTADAGPFLYIVSRRLGEGALSHLPVLQELLAQCGGVARPGNATDDQVLATGAAASLQEAMSYNTRQLGKGAVERFRRALSSGWGHGNAVVPLWIQTAQVAESAAFSESAKGARFIKTVATFHDDAANAFQQVCSLVSGTGAAAMVERMLPSDRELFPSPDDIPSLKELTCEFGLSPSVAFALLRPWIRGASMPKAPSGSGIRRARRASKRASSSSSSSEGESGLVGADGHPTQSSRWTLTGSELQGQVARLADVPTGVFPSKAEGASHPGQMSPSLATWFWSLELFDVFFSEELYRKGEETLRELLRSKEHAHEEAMQDAKDDRTRATLKKEMDALRSKTAALIRELRRDAPEHAEHVTRVRAAFCSLAPWFATGETDVPGAIAAGRTAEDAPPLEWGRLGEALAKHCLLPRAVLSGKDALYCVHFLQLLFEADLPRVGFMRCLNSALFGATRQLLSSTEAESAHLGVFLAGVLEWVSGWREDRAKYEGEACRKRGLLRAYTSGQPPGDGTVPSDGPRLSFVQFTKVCTRWDEVLTDTLSDLLGSQEPMRRKASLAVTNRLIPVAPRSTTDLSLILAAVERVRDDDAEHKDLTALARTSAGMVAKRIREVGGDSAVPAEYLPRAVTAKITLDDIGEGGKPSMGPPSLTRETSRPVVVVARPKGDSNRWGNNPRSSPDAPEPSSWGSDARRQPAGYSRGQKPSTPTAAEGKPEPVRNPKRERSDSNVAAAEGKPHPKRERSDSNAAAASPSPASTAEEAKSRGSRNRRRKSASKGKE
jgi:hypothetical protein